MQNVNMDSIPAIDFSEADQMVKAANLAKAMKDVGFVYLDNVPGFDKDVEAALLEASKWFFSLPLEEKMTLAPKKWNSSSDNVYRGYVPVDVSSDQLREQFETGETLPEDSVARRSGVVLYEPTPYPRTNQEDGIKFRKLFESARKTLSDAGIEMLRLCSLGLGLDKHTYDSKFFPESVSSLRIMHYPTYEHVKGDLNTFTCEEHVDSIFVTLLITFGSWGLEIERSDGSWLKVPPRPGSLVVNIGNLLSRLTGGKLKATKHRVRDIGTDRYSMPFFLEPRADASFTFPDDSSKIVYGQWMIESIKRRFPYQFGHLPDYNPTSIS